MGFNMIKFKSILVALTFLLSGFLFASCDNQEKKTKNMGPEVDETQIAAAIKDASGDDSPLNIKAGEFVYTETTQTLKNLTQNLLEQDAVTVTKKTETDTDWILTVVHETIDYREKPERHYSDEKEFYIAKPGTLSTSSEVSAPSEAQVTPRSLVALNIKPESSTKVTFHNFKTSQALEDPPALVQAQENCGGLTNCKINVTTISYDMVVWENDVKNEKLAIVKRISPDVPFLARTLDHCQQTGVTVEGQRIVVTICAKVQNFKFGHD